MRVRASTKPRFAAHLPEQDYHPFYANTVGRQYSPVVPFPVVILGSLSSPASMLLM